MTTNISWMVSSLMTMKYIRCYVSGGTLPRDIYVEDGFSGDVPSVGTGYVRPDVESVSYS